MPATTPSTASAHAPGVRGASPPPPTTSDILEQVRAIERILAEAPEDSALAAAVRPFLAVVRVLLSLEAKLDKLSAALAQQT